MKRSEFIVSWCMCALLAACGQTDTGSTGVTTDLVAQYPEVAARMSGQLASWRESVAFSIGGDEAGAMQTMQSPH